MAAAAQTVAVAGGTGFIGRHVVTGLRAAGHEVRVLARSTGVDLAREIDPACLAGCDLVVNLVGIKRATASQGWDAVHVDLPARLADAADRAGVSDLVHVSVAGCAEAEARDGVYLHSKAEGERVLRARSAGPRITILRPGVVYGPGDDMLRNLADSIRAAPLFPAPRAGRAELSPLAVEDLADAVVRLVERPGARGRDYDLVGPERLSLRELVARVSASARVDRSCVVVGLPGFVLAPAAAVLERISSDPLITRAQLGLLTRGVVGDPGPAREALDWSPRALDAATIDAVLADYEARLPSVRLVPDPAAAAELEALAGAASPARILAFAVLAVAALLAGPALPGSIWQRMAGLELGLLSVALIALRLDWARLWRPSPTQLLAGLGAGVLMWAGAFAVAAGLAAAVPQVWAESASIYAWADGLNIPLALALLTLIVAGEEIVWRGALGLGLVPLLGPRFGPWSAVFASAALFTVAHLTTGPPVLALAAALAGGAWTYLAIRTRSLAASFVAHLGWDAAMLWITPLA